MAEITKIDIVAITRAEYDQMQALLMWALFHHQGGESVIGQPIRKALGIGQHDRLTDDQITAAKIAGYPVTSNV